MTDEIWNAVVSGGSVSVLLGGVVYFQYRQMNKREEYWQNEVNRVRSVGEKIIAQKDGIILQKDQDILDQSKQSEEKLLQAMAKTDERIGSVVKMYEQKVTDKDGLLDSIRQEMQGVLVDDATLRARQIDSLNNLTDALKDALKDK